MYQNYNPNPYIPTGKQHIFGDCVVRAICAATGKGWFEVYDMLCKKGRQIGDFGNSRQVYPLVLEELGFESSGIKRKKGEKALTVRDFCESHKEGIYILKLAHHLTCIKDGICYDTWFPQKKTIYRIYRKDRIKRWIQLSISFEE